MFSVDTSGFLDAWARHYPPDIFETLWSHMDKAALDGTIKASEEVIAELSRKDDGASEWIESRQGMVVRTDELVQKQVTSLLKNYPRLIDVSKNRSGGDPFVIAVAQLSGYTVITGETSSGNMNRPRIPDICLALDVPCINILEFIRGRGWKI